MLRIGCVFCLAMVVSFVMQPMKTAHANNYCRGLTACSQQPSYSSIRSGCQDLNSQLNALKGEEAGIAAKWPGLSQQNQQLNATASAQQGVPASGMADAMRGAYSQQAGEAQACSAKAAQLQMDTNSWRGQASSGLMGPTAPSCAQAINSAAEGISKDAEEVRRKCDQHNSDANQLKERVGRTDNTVDEIKQEDNPQPQEQEQGQDQGGDDGSGGGSPGGAPPPGGGEEEPQEEPRIDDEEDKPKYVTKKEDDEDKAQDKDIQEQSNQIEEVAGADDAAIPLKGDETVSQRLERFGHEGDSSRAGQSRIAAHSQRDPSTRRSASAGSLDRRLSDDQRREYARELAAYDLGEDPKYYKQDTLLRQGDVALSPDFLDGDSTIKPFDTVEVTYQLSDGSEKSHRGRYIDIVDDGSRGRVRLYDPENRHEDLHYARIVSVKHARRRADKNHTDPSRRAAAVQAERTGMSFRDSSWPEGFAGDNSRPR